MSARAVVTPALLRLFAEDFSNFLRRRRLRRHFVRPHWWTALPDGETRAAPALLAPGLLAAATETPAAALARLGSRPQGLTAAQAAARLARDGPNEVAHEAPLPGMQRLWQCYRNPFNLLLTVLAGLSWLSGDARATVVIAMMVLLSTLLRFVQEGRSRDAAEGLRKLVANTATVLRPAADGGAGVLADEHAAVGEIRGGMRGEMRGEVRSEVPVRQLVCGDVVALSAGDMLPADCRLLAARDLFVAQAALTGESAPVEKSADCAQAPASALEARNLAFMGTSVVSGSGTALVLATGEHTCLGVLAAGAGAQGHGPSAFEAGVNAVSWLLIRFGAVMVPIVFLINGLSKASWLEAFLFAVSVAVGLTPEMLPMIVTSTLAKGALLLSRKKVVVKRLDAIQNFGAMDVLCTDKTGTLTQDRIAVARALDADGHSSAEVLDFAFLNSYYQTGLKNLLDHAVLARLEKAEEMQLEQRYRKIDELPFDFQRRRMSVLVAERSEQSGERHVLICKGAVDEVLAVCTALRRVGADRAAVPLDSAGRARVLAQAGALGADGLRLVAVAIRQLPPGQALVGLADEAELTLLGFIAFVDPPKESAAPALRALAAHGIAVKVLSGDNAQVTTHVCRLVGLAGGPVLLGAQVAAMDQAALRAAVESCQVFARLAPQDKQRIVQALRANGHVVGFMGDGINDAAALRAADIGISVDSAVDIAREAADIILLEKSLLVLDQGVIEGRTTFCNMLKYIRMTASSNFGNVLSVLVASALLPFLPMLPLQLLVQNLLYDISQTGIPFDRVDPALVARPLHWKPREIGRFMLYFGPISSLFDLLTFALLWWGFHADSVARQGLFQSGWFLVGLLSQTLIVYLIRSPSLPFVGSRPGAALLAMTAAIAAFGLWLPFGPLAAALKLQPLPPAFFAALAALLLGYFAAVSLMKRYYVRRFGWL